MGDAGNKKITGLKRVYCSRLFEPEAERGSKFSFLFLTWRVLYPKNGVMQWLQGGTRLWTLKIT